jgi:REP element-mobilizing transposase RayT
MPAPHSRKLRIGRYSEAGRIYLITTVTAARRPVFEDFTNARKLIQLLREIEQHELAETLAFVVMPDHLHWLMALGKLRELSSVVGTLKSLSTRRLCGPVWQPGFHDHAVRKNEDLPALARYIVANPLRAGLVSTSVITRIGMSYGCRRHVTVGGPSSGRMAFAARRPLLQEAGTMPSFCRRTPSCFPNSIPTTNWMRRCSRIGQTS